MYKLLQIFCAREPEILENEPVACVSGTSDEPFQSTACDLKMKRISSDELYTSVTIGRAQSDETEWQAYQPGKYIACVYDSRVYWQYQRYFG